MTESTELPPTGSPYNPPTARWNSHNAGDKRPVWPWVVGCGCLVVVILGALAIFGAGHFGLRVFSEQVANELRDNPVVIEHLGTLQELEVEFAASAAAPGENEFVFQAKGSKGEGRIRADCVTVGADEEVVAGTLEMASGEIYDLFPDRQLESTESPDS